jgi:proteasome lid subunit RPN8/RPN11
VKVNFFPVVEAWSIPESAFRLAMEEMARDGLKGTEGIALWLGGRRGNIAVVSHLAFLRGHGIVKAPDFVRIEPALFNEIADIALANELILVGQIHSHGPGYGTSLSWIDRVGGMAVPHYLSAVAPDYAIGDSIAPVDCGFHVYDPGSGYRLMKESEARERVRFLPAEMVDVLTVGE